MYECQHCGEPGISLTRKLLMGPAAPHTCRACGGATGVPYYSVLVLLPPIACLGLMVAWPLPEHRWPLLAFAAAFLATPILASRVPLVKR